MSDVQPYDPPAPRPPHPPAEPSVPDAQVTAPHPWAVAQPTWQGPTVLTDRQDVGAAVVAIAWVVAVLTLGYMLPWAIAASRGKSNHGAVAIVNFFLGWSLIGWVVALVMACTAHRMVGATGQTMVVVAQQFPQAQFSGPVPQPRVGPGPGWYPSPSGQGQQYWDGSVWTEHRAP
jgi:Protein of unknown function (DUF2510).